MKRLIGVISLFILISQPVYGWWGAPIPGTGVNDHSELTEQALIVVENNDSQNKYSEISSNILNVYDDIIELSSGAFDFRSLFSGPKGKDGYLNSSVSHFYHPNGSAYNDQWPSALTESYDWLDEAISDYSKGGVIDKTVAYQKLGYILHLQQDMAVPAHTHLIYHGTDPWDYLEWEVDADNINASTKPPIQAYSLQGNDLYAIERQFTELAKKSYNESDNQTLIDAYYGNGSYIGSNFDCPLYGNCSPLISDENITILQNDLMPKAVQYSAGLAMRVHDIFKSLDWPTYHHDNRRTGFTLLKGDIESTSKSRFTHLVMTSGVTIDALARPSVADIDNSGDMDTVISYSFTESGSGYISDIEYSKRWFLGDKKWNHKWTTNISYKVSAAPSLANLDSDNGKEVVVGLGNGTLIVIDPDGTESPPIKWAYTVDNRSCPVGGDTRKGQLGFTAVSDIDNDGVNEIVFTTADPGCRDFYGDLYVANITGNNAMIEANISLGNEGGAWGAVAIANVDSDDREEIVVPGYYGIKVYDFDNNQLSLKCNNTDGKIEAAPVIYDVDRDNEYEIIYPTSTNACSPDKTCLDKLYIINASSCTLENSTSLDVQSQVGVSIANLDSDSNLEIALIGRNAETGYYKVESYDSNTLTKEWEYAGGGTLSLLAAAPNIADIDGDGNYNIIVGKSTTSVLILNNDGALKEEFDVIGQMGSTPVIGDLEGKGKAMLAVKRAGSPIVVFTSFTGSNSPPEIENIGNITAIAGQLIDINESGLLSAKDTDGNPLAFFYSSPFNESGLWQSTINDTGNYSILIEVSDGNLSDYRYIDLFVFNSTYNVTEQFADGTQNKTLAFSGGDNQTIQVRLPKNSTIIYSKISIKGFAP